MDDTTFLESTLTPSPSPSPPPPPVSDLPPPTHAGSEAASPDVHSPAPNESGQSPSPQKKKEGGYIEKVCIIGDKRYTLKVQCRTFIDIQEHTVIAPFSSPPLPSSTILSIYSVAMHKVLIPCMYSGTPLLWTLGDLVKCPVIGRGQG